MFFTPICWYFSKHSYLFFCVSAAGDRYLIQSNALSGWFLGPRAENRHVFNELMNQTIDQHQQNRRKYWPTDPEYISKAQKWTPAYKAEKKQLKDKLKEMNDDLALSTPVFSPRFQVQNNDQLYFYVSN